MWEDKIKNARILIVDDQEANVLYLESALEKAGYTNFQSTTDSREVLFLFGANRPDLLLLDLMMPHLDGFAVMEQLKSLVAPDSYLPILVLTADVSPETRQRALSSGANDFLVKPFDPREAALRIHNLLSAWFLHIMPQQQNQILEEMVRERTRELEESQLEVLGRLAQAAEFRDDDTGQHTRRVGEMAAQLAELLQLPPEQMRLFAMPRRCTMSVKSAFPTLFCSNLASSPKKNLKLSNPTQLLEPGCWRVEALIS
jgi:putative two-component system response regulator